MKLGFAYLLLAIYGVPMMIANGEVDRAINGIRRLGRWIKEELIP